MRRRGDRREERRESRSRGRRTNPNLSSGRNARTIVNRPGNGRRGNNNSTSTSSVRSSSSSSNYPVGLGGNHGHVASSSFSHFYANPPKVFYCHSCNGQTTTTTDVETRELSCNQCNGNFVEEVSRSSNLGDIDDHYETDSEEDDESDSGFSHPGQHWDGPIIANVFESLFSNFREVQRGEVSLPSGGYLQNLFGPSSDGLASHPGNYVFGNARFDALLATMFQGGANTGPPPASKAAVKALPRVRITAEDIKAEDGAIECVVCKDNFEIGGECIQLPCKHRFHQDCIKPWLEKHNTCPTCRHELPTENPDRESRKRRSSSSSSDVQISNVVLHESPGVHIRRVRRNPRELEHGRSSRRQRRYSPGGRTSTNERRTSANEHTSTNRPRRQGEGSSSSTPYDITALD
mmetsp:Transcript_5899/g.9179  ORF Transcript_5899/g.9179 Transcript_5899/m.9179 type:complete len:406 (-) Transcript_5899:2263-3480(-)